MVIVFFIAAVLALAGTIVPGQKAKSKRLVRAGFFVLFGVACALSMARYFYESRRFTEDIFENFIAASHTVPAKSGSSVPNK